MCVVFITANLHFIGAAVKRRNIIKEVSSSGWHPIKIVPLIQKKTLSGLVVFTPEPGKNQCWDSPLPCTTSNRFNPDLRLRIPGKLASGFTVTMPQKNAEQAAQKASSVSLRGARALWVDDNNPDPNRYERKALEVLGVTFDLARNTKEAEDYLKQTRYAVVISDFYRTDDPIGGYTLLEAVKRIPNAPPYIIYSSQLVPIWLRRLKRRELLGKRTTPSNCSTW